MGLMPLTITWFVWRNMLFLFTLFARSHMAIYRMHVICCVHVPCNANEFWFLFQLIAPWRMLLFAIVFSFWVQVIGKWLPPVAEILHTIFNAFEHRLHSRSTQYRSQFQIWFFILRFLSDNTNVWHNFSSFSFLFLSFIVWTLSNRDRFAHWKIR